MEERSLSETEIVLENIDFSYRKNHVLDHLSFRIPLGHSIAILGANGCGKSTLLSILAGVRKCIGARMLYGNEDLLRNTQLRRTLLGYVPQTDPLLSDVSVYDNLLLWYKGTKKEFTEALTQPDIEMLKLTDFLKKPVRTLSGGMRKRAALALALINSPKILILDEPASALDLCYKAEIREYLKRFHDAGGTLILTTHDEEDLDITDVLYLLKNHTIAPAAADLRGEALIEALRN